MGSKKTIVKALAAGAVLGAIASLIMSMRHTEEGKDIGKTAEKIRKRVALHAKKIGKLSKSAYDAIVETTLAEYRGVKAMSDSELQELKIELKEQWTHLSKILKKK